MMGLTPRIPTEMEGRVSAKTGQHVDHMRKRAEDIYLHE